MRKNKAKRLAMRVDFGLSCEGGDQTAFMPNSIRRSTQRLDSWQAYFVEAKNFSGGMAPGAADTREAETDARIQILTRPIGALVFLEGENSMAFRRSAIIRDWGKFIPARKPRAFSSVSRNSAAPAFRSISIFAAPRR